MSQPIGPELKILFVRKHSAAQRKIELVLRQRCVRMWRLWCYVSGGPRKAFEPYAISAYPSSSLA